MSHRSLQRPLSGGERLKLICAHDAQVLLKNSLSAPKLQYSLRAACCEGHNLLTTLHNMLRSAFCSISNVTLTGQQWLQASLPVRAGGLGIRRVSALAPSAFLSSAAGTRVLQDLILRRTERTADNVFVRCLVSQLSKFPMLPPSGSVAAEIAASRKELKYSTLSHSYEFFPVAIEMLGPLSASNQIFLSEIGRRIAQ
jgi:hypothetical protein